MSKKSFDPHNCIAALNTVKRAMQLTGKPFSKEKMVSNLKNCGLPTSNEFWSAFRNSGVIQEVAKGQFMFTSKEPIFEGELVNIKVKYQELRSKYQKKSVKPESVVKSEPEIIPIVKNDSKIQEAINLLKNHGYLIFAPTYTQV